MHDLPRPGHVPVHAQDVLRGWVTVPREVGQGVDEELAHVAVALSPQVAAYLERKKKSLAVCNVCVYFVQEKHVVSQILIGTYFSQGYYQLPFSLKYKHFFSFSPFIKSSLEQLASHSRKNVIKTKVFFCFF